MKKISIFLILTSFILMIVSATFVSAATTDDFDYGVIVFNEANLGTHTDSNVYVKTVNGAVQVDPSKTLYCQNNVSTNAKRGVFSQDKLDEMYSFFKGYLSISGATTLSKSDLENPNRTINLSLSANQVMIIRIDSSTTNIQTKFMVNGQIVSNYSEIAGRVYWLYDGSGTLRLNSDQFFGVMIAPDATVIVEGCGNYDGSLICKNLSTRNEVHQVKRTSPQVTTTKTTTVTTTTEPETTDPKTTDPETTDPKTTEPETTEPETTTTSKEATAVTTVTSSQSTSDIITSVATNNTKDDTPITPDPSEKVTTSNNIIEIDKDDIPLESNPKTEAIRTSLMVASFLMLLSGSGLLAYKKLKK